MRVAAVAAWILASAVVVAASWGLSIASTSFANVGVVFGLLDTTLLAAATVIAKAALRAQQALDEQLQASAEQLRWEIARVHQIQWHQQRLLARAVHGPVASAVVQLAATSDMTDSSQLRHLVAQVLDEAVANDATPTDLRRLMADVERSWRWVCAVTWSIEPGAELGDGQWLTSACLADILQESISNAVRHGGAQHVRIAINPGHRALQVTVLDDGHPASQGSGKGLGSRMLDDCCLDWRRSREESGTLLWLLLPAVLQPDRLDPPLLPVDSPGEIRMAGLNHAASPQP